MCGIAGIFGAPTAENELRADVADMTAALAHRGPDAGALWVDHTAGIALGHRRLSVIDLSEDGAQPMSSASNRFVIVYNGEIYNYLELREELEQRGYTFRGHSDTEVALAAFEAWGVKAALCRFNGMFAFALWDKHHRRLYLGRDRVGKKPLYYGVANGRLLFGSELKALRDVGGWHGGVDPFAARAFLQYGFIPGDMSILSGVRKLPPGHLLVFSSPDATPQLEPFWKLEDVIAAGIADPFKGTESEAEERLATLLSDAVRIRRRADVPVGAFLSGGVDSALVVALMQQSDAEPVHTYTVGFADSEYDESHAAERVASWLGCRHTSFLLEPSDVRAIVPTLPQVYDEPFGDVSQVPTVLVSRVARREVTVCLSGDGGDETFGGYHRHFLTARFWPWLARTPLPLRRACGQAIGTGSIGRWVARTGVAGQLRTPDEKLTKMAAVLGARNLQEAYQLLLSQANRSATLNGTDVSLLGDAVTIPEGMGAARKVMALDTLCYLPGDVLVKVDRASMCVGLELRCPLLDCRVIDFAWQLPDSWHIGKSGKRLLRAVLQRYVPRELFERPKMGFAVPIEDWLRGPLCSWAEDLLMAPEHDGFVSASDVTERWQRHRAGERGHGHWLWRVLMWRAWRQHWHV